MNFNMQLGINKILFSIILCLLIMASNLKADTSLGFELQAGDRFLYKIELSFLQISRFHSGPDNILPGEQVRLTGEITLFETIEVLEREDDDYGKIICRFDSLKASLESSVEGLATAIIVEAWRDSLIILQGDSLIASYNPDSTLANPAMTFYERLLFVGEDIAMLVYPDGQILNITENKNLWLMARNLLGLPGEGFLEIIFPPQKSVWEEAQDIGQIGDFELKQSPPQLIMRYRLDQNQKNLDFSGKLNIAEFVSPVAVSDLDNELIITMNDFVISKSGSAQMSPAKDILQQMQYEVFKSGRILLQNPGADKKEIGIRMDFEGKVRYFLLD